MNNGHIYLLWLALNPPDGKGSVRVGLGGVAVEQSEINVGCVGEVGPEEGIHNIISLESHVVSRDSLRAFKRPNLIRPSFLPCFLRLTTSSRS